MNWKYLVIRFAGSSGKLKQFILYQDTQEGCTVFTNNDYNEVGLQVKLQVIMEF